MKPSHSRIHRFRGPAFCFPIFIGSILHGAQVTVDNATDELDGDTSSIANLIATPGPTGISIREAVEAANNTAGADEILFDVALNTVTILIDTLETDEDDNVDGDLDISDPDGLTITGNGVANTILDGNSDGRIFHALDPSGDLTFSGLTLQNGDTSGLDSDRGGALHLDGTGIFAMTSCNLINNDAGNSGGAVYESSNRISQTLIDCTFTNNRSGIGNSNNRGAGALRLRGENLSVATLRDCVFTNNIATGDGGAMEALATEGTIVIDSCEFTGNQAGQEGGVMDINPTNGILKIFNSSFTGNSAATDGGALHRSSSDGSALISGSTFSGNSCGRDGGAIHDGSAGAPMTILNSTFSGNTADENGGAIANDVTRQAMVFRFVTITGNSADNDADGTGDGGGVDIEESGPDPGVEFYNCIVQGNDDKTPAETLTDDCSSSGGVGFFTSFGGNVFGLNTGCPVGGDDTTSSAMLGALADNGGATMTHELLAGSAAIDFTTDEAEPLDQRGVGRLDGSPDAGAFEAGSTLVTVTTSNDIVDGDTSSIVNLAVTPGPDGFISLREALTAANNTAGEDTILFNPSTNGLPIVLTIAPTDEDANANGDLDINDAGGLSIVGNGRTHTIIDGNGTERVLDHRNGNLTLSGLAARNGQGSDAGGIQSSLSSPATLTIVDTLWEQHDSGDAGGALYISGQHTEVNLRDSVIRDNTSNDIGAGGYVWTPSSDTRMIRCQFLGNDAGAQGGGLYIQSNLLLFQECLFSGNHSDETGGAIYSSNTSRMTGLLDSQFLMNTATHGGGLHASGTGEQVYMERCTFEGNGASEEGGGLRITTSSAAATIVDSTFYANTATINGGGISHESGSNSTLSISNSTISGNRAGNHGGGIHHDSFETTLSLDHVTVTENIADDDADGAGDGGGLEISRGTTVVFNLSNSIVQGNDDESPAQTSADDCGNSGGAGSFVSLGGNVFGEGTGCPVGASDTTAPANLLAISTSEPDSGTRYPATHRISTDSSAFNFATSSTEDLDARGLPRVDGARDAGAVELQFWLSDLGNYNEWVSFHGLTPGGSGGMFSDPNGDGVANYYHFALDEDPLGNGTSSGKLRGAVENVGGQDYFTLTAPIRDNAYFYGSPLQTNRDGITYTIRANEDLTAADTLAVEVTPALDAGLPPLSNLDGSGDTEYEYHTFRLPDPINTRPKGFLWIKVEPNVPGFEED